MKRIFLWPPLILAILATQTSFSAEFIRWQAKEKRVDADIHTWSLPKVLGTITEATGWQMFVEPGVDQQISVKFNNLPPGEALKRLLGGLSYKVTPETNGLTLIHVFQTAPQNATQLVRAPVSATNKPSRQLIPNELIVTLKPGADIDKIARELGAKVTGRIDGLNTYRLTFSDEAAAGAGRDALTGNSQVAQIDNNYSMERPVVADTLGATGSATINLKPVATGAGSHLVVGLIDTPVQPLGGGMDQFILKALSAAGESNPDPNFPTHGTSMAETILRGISYMAEQNTSNVRILPVDVYGNNSSTTTYDVAYGIYLAINNGAMVINLSLGSDGNSSFLHSVITSGSQQGVLFFGAAGNTPVSTPTYPAAYPEVVAVTAGDKKGNIASYANYGSFVDAVAPGSTLVYFNGRSYYVSGTSASTAYASGMAAGLVDSSGKSLSAAASAITTTFAPKQTK